MLEVEEQRRGKEGWEEFCRLLRGKQDRMRGFERGLRDGDGGRGAGWIGGREARS